MLAARKKKLQSACRMSRSMASPSEFLIISQPCEYGSVSTRKDWGVRVPARIMMVPTFMMPDNRVSPYVEDTGGTHHHCLSLLSAHCSPSGRMGPLERHPDRDDLTSGFAPSPR